jgi:MarR family transcriptional regulator, negative regulator of the multidrug operon emrRAB
MTPSSSSAALVHLLAHPGASVESLSGVLKISQPGAVQTVNRLAASGLLERRRGPDERTLALHLTTPGRRAARALLGQRARSMRELLRPLEPDERAALLPLLEKIVSALADDRASALAACRLCDRAACYGTAECPLQHTVPAAA